MPVEEPCPRCGAGRPANAPAGLCPRCLLRLGLDADLSAGSDDAAADAREDAPASNNGSWNLFLAQTTAPGTFSWPQNSVPG